MDLLRRDGPSWLLLLLIDTKSERFCDVRFFIERIDNPAKRGQGDEIYKG
jgi:hypothetical protein